jgi:hypothetical protein
MNDRCIDKLAAIEKNFTEFWNAMSGLPGFTARIDTMRYGSRPQEIGVDIRSLSRELSSEFFILETDAVIGRAVRQVAKALDP